jgi:hypothetical protein
VFNLEALLAHRLTKLFMCISDLSSLGQSQFLNKKNMDFSEQNAKQFFFWLNCGFAQPSWGNSKKYILIFEQPG